MTAVTFHDGYRDAPTTPRERLAEELRRLKVQHWSDPGDVELKERVEEAEAVLRAHDARGDAR